MDKERMLDLLTKLAEGIAVTFGKNCETLIQDLGRPDIPVLAIFNGHVSGRSVGSTLDIFGNETKHVDETLLQRDFVNMIVLRGNQKIKSTTMIIRGEDYCLGLGINLDITLASAYADTLMEQFRIEDYLDTAIESDRQSRLDDLFDSCVEEIGISPQIMKKKQRLELIRLLSRKRAFDYQKAVPLVAEKLGVSRYTVYKYLNELESEE